MNDLHYLQSQLLLLHLKLFHTYHLSPLTIHLHFQCCTRTWQLTCELN